MLTSKAQFLPLQYRPRCQLRPLITTRPALAGKIILKPLADCISHTARLPPAGVGDFVDEVVEIVGDGVA